MTVPTARAALRACREPLIAYGLAVAAALALMVLLVVAIAISDGGGDDPSSEIDIKVIGTLVGIPFQLAAMGLGGSLGFGDSDFSVALFAPPLLITAVFLVALFRLSRRAERAATSASTLERGLLAASGASVTAIVALVLTRTLAMRDDDVVTHAAGFGLVLGILLVGGTVAFLGRQAAVTSLWPRWLPADGRRALHLSAQHLVVAVIVLSPITWLWWLIDSSVEAAVYSVIWSPTVALAALGLGHLGGVTSAGETEFAWDLGWFTGIVLPLVALALVLVAALAWHLRRGGDRALLQHPASWMALPASYAGAGLVLCLLTTVGVHGEIFGVDGGLWVSIAYWLIPVLAVWGAVIELLSRTVAPALAGALPASLARRLGKGPAHPVSPPAGPVQQVPMSPDDQQRARKALIGVGIVAAVALLGGIALSVIGSTAFGPESRAEAYLDALVDGDVEEAVDLAPVDDGDGSTALLTNDVYGAAEDRITGYEITDIETDGDTTTVTVDLEGVEGGDDVEFVLEADGRRALLFRDWKVTDNGLASIVSVSMPEGSTSLRANGVSVDVGDGDEDLWALPGTYAFDPFDESEWLESSGSETVVSPGDYFTYAEFEDPQPSEALKAHVDSVVADALAACMEATELDPADCPQDTYGYGDRQRNVAWRLTTPPALSWDSFYGFPTTLYSDSASATVTYEYAYVYPGERPDWTEQEEETSIYLSVEVDLVDDEPVVTFADY